MAGYRWLKDRVPLERRAALKIALARARGFSDVSTSAAPALNRALWEVQTTRYALPTHKFRATFCTLHLRAGNDLRTVEEQLEYFYTQYAKRVAPLYGRQGV